MFKSSIQIQIFKFPMFQCKYLNSNIQIEMFKCKYSNSNVQVQIFELKISDTKIQNKKLVQKFKSFNSIFSLFGKTKKKV